MPRANESFDRFFMCSIPMLKVNYEYEEPKHEVVATLSPDPVSRLNPTSWRLYF